MAYSSLTSLFRFQKRLTSIVFLLLLGSSDLMAGEVSLSFTKGYLGTQASNTNTSDNIKTFTTLGISRVSFNQVDVNGDGLFGGGTQGNDLSGTIKIYLNSGQIISLNGALNWRETTGSRIEVFGIIFDANQTATINYGSNQSFVIRGGDVSRSSTSMGLKKYASAFTFVDDTNRSGNAANGMLDELNAELQNSPQPSTISAPSVVEGNNLVYTVTLNIATSANVPQAYTFTKEGTATASGDYSPTFTFSNGVVDNGDGTITVPGSVSSFTITASTIDDITPEATETLILNVGSKSGTGSITDNDVTLTTSVASLTAFSTCTGSASTAQSFTFSGNIYSGTVTVTAPTGFEISQTQNGTYTASIAYSFGGTSVAATTVWVRAKSTATNGLSGNVTVASTGATTQNVAISVTVNTIPTITVSPSSSTIVVGGSVTLTASGGSTYAWSPITNLSNSNTSSVTASPSSTISYTVTGTSAGGCSNTAVATVTVNAALVAGAIAADQTICVGATPATLTSTTPASGGVGTINYQWETSANNSTWSDVASATSATYSPGAISANTYYRRKASTVNDAAVYTSSVMITVQQSVGGSIAGSAAVCAGTNSTVLTLSGYTGSITKWQSSLNSNFSSATDINSTTASITATNLSATTYYRAVVTLGSCTSVNSASASVTVNALPSISVHVIPDVTTSATTFSIPYSGLSSGADLYSLAVGTISMTNFVAVSNASITTTPLVVSIPASTQNTYDFNLTVKNSSTGCTAQTSFNLGVTDINPGSVGTDQTICYGTAPATFTNTSDASGGGGSPTYIWQISTAGASGPYSDISGATSATYTHPTALTANTYFRRKATIGASIATSHPIEVIVTALPTVTVTPSSASITVGSSVNLTASGATTYSWSPSTGLSATNTAAVTATPTATTTYTVTGTSSSCSSTSTVTVTVNPALTAGSISANQTICVGATPATLTSSTDAAGNINFNTSTGSGISITNGGFNLMANKTYKLEAAVGGASGGYAYYAWVDNTNTLLSGGSIGAVMKAGATYSDAPQDKAIVYFTPSVDTRIFLRVYSISGSLTAYAPSTSNNFSSTWASIQQVGSSAFVNPWTASGNDVYNTSGDVGIGTSSPSASAILDLTSTSKGLLPPRVALTSKTGTSSPVASPQTGLIVYNTASAGTGGDAVTPGYYYFNGTIWTRMDPEGWSTGVPITFGAPSGSTAPTKGTTTVDYVRYRNLGGKEYEVEYNYAQSVVSNNAGNGDYLISLPGGLQFDYTAPGQTAYTGATGVGAISARLTSAFGDLYHVSAHNATTAVPYDATRFRIHTNSWGTVGWTFYNYTYYQLTVTSAGFKMTFKFKAL